MKASFFSLVLALSLMFTSTILKAQTYTKLADSALHTMWDAKDTIGYRKALNLYEKAFSLYPKEINSLGYYKAAVLAGELKELDRAFAYLNKLLSLNTDKNTTWSSLTGTYVKGEYKNLLNDPRWPALAAKAEQMKAVFYQKLAANQAEFQSGGLGNINFSTAKNGEAAYQMIKNAGSFKPKKLRNYSIQFKVADSLTTSYFVSLPKNYDPKKRYPVLFFLHGAVQSNGFSTYQDDGVLEDWNRFYTKYATQHNVIMVYPQGSKKYNWMAPDDGFFMVPAMLKELKQSINVDDDKVFVTGHSNGATGSFSYLMKQQTPFAGFFGFNTQPKVRNGGTFVKNVLNRSYFNVSTDEDYYYPPDANDTLNVIMKNLGADYQDHRYKGWPHWFPQFDESEPVYPMIFNDIGARKRPSFQSKLYWECDNVKYGRADWIQIDQLDTVGKKAAWHQQVNFNIHKLLSYDKNDNLVSKDTLVKAFNFPRKSGAVRATYHNNRFEIETSEVKSLTVYISPEMVDFNQPVTIVVNGVEKMKRKPVYDKALILANFKETLDRKAIWVDRFTVTVN
jgi:predicted esterase